METRNQADAIRSSWTRWLANATDDAVLNFHKQVIDLLESERTVDPVEVTPFGYGVINSQLLDDVGPEPTSRQRNLIEQIRAAGKHNDFDNEFTANCLENNLAWWHDGIIEGGVGSAGNPYFDALTLAAVPGYEKELATLAGLWFYDTGDWGRDEQFAPLQTLHLWWD